MSFDLSHLSAEDLLALKAKLDSIAGSDQGRSPIRPRQLHNLTLLPTKDDPRPTFFFSAESPRSGVGPGSPYPALRWHGETGREITVRTAKEDAALGPEWQRTPPVTTPETEADRFQREFAALSPEDQQWLIEADRKAKLDRLTAAMGTLSDRQRDQLMPAGPVTKTKIKSA